MSLNEYIKEIVGKKIIGVLVHEGEGEPRNQVLLVFDDDTYFEFYGSNINFAKGLWPGGPAKAKARLHDRKIKFEFYDETNESYDSDMEEDVEAGSFDEELERISDVKKGKLKQIYSLPAPKKCDLCSRSFESERFFIDGALRNSSQWANMCPECFADQGQGIAWGKGQLYMRQEDGKWLLTAGFPPGE